MKKNKIAILFLCSLSLLMGCNDFLNVEPLDKVSGNQLVSTEGGLKTLLATLYNGLPIEDFTYRPNKGFNQHGWDGVPSMSCTSFYTDESTRSDGIQGIDQNNWDFYYWPYSDIRQLNLFFQDLDKAKDAGVLNSNQYPRLVSEAHFIRAYMYFGMAKRYGGVPLIDKVLDNNYNPGGDNSALFVPRDTELNTWKFILKECDLAIESLPTSVPGDEGEYRATKWAAYALKSRVALHAASVAKYWNKAPLAGDAVSEKLVGGMSSSDADFFYNECIKASEAVINNSGKTLYRPNPANRDEALVNYQNIFLTKNEEIIFSKAYIDGTSPETQDQGHSYDIYYSPSQVNPGYHKYGRYNPTLNIVDLYEDYTDNGMGQSTLISTRTDGNETIVQDKITVNFNPAAIPFVKYNSLYEPFKNKDIRLLASVIVPGGIFKGTNIIIQGGLIKTDGSALIYTDGNSTGLDGKKYYAYGAESSANFSGFYGLGDYNSVNFTTTGFTIRKYLQENKSVQGVENSSTTSFIDMRLAELYLNYAEAVVESGNGDVALAANCMNALRKRAGHSDAIPLTLKNVLKERQVELAFEGFRYWDLIRRREYHEVFDHSSRKVLVPILDLREPQPKYVFVRTNFYSDEYNGGYTFQAYRYYKPIPGRSTNNLTENPNY